MTRSTRRGFLKASAAGGYLALGGLGKGPCGAEPDKSLSPDSRTTGAVLPSGVSAAGSPVIVLAPDVSTDVNPRARAWIYIVEILQRAGVFFELLPLAGLPSLSRRPKSVVVLAGNLPLGSADRQALAAWVKEGGSLVGIGGTSTLNEVFGVTGESPLSEGWMKVVAVEHPVTAGLRSSLHVFGGYAVKRGPATALAELESGKQGARGSAIVENRFGKGRTVLLAPDLLFSIVYIQQGLPVFQDGNPSPDDTAPINEGILKAEDGLVLDWQRDRTPLAPDDKPVFLEPITDELREIVLRSIFHLAQQQGIALPVLWYWPRSLKAVGHISHDSDGNDPKKAVALLDVMNRIKVKSTWCTLFPGGYPREFYSTLAKQGFEIALHYDALTGGKETSWSKENFLLQHGWLMKEAGLRHIAGNKNHYTRWEGRLDFYRWCEEAGIVYDQTRGPSKKGTIGFPLGGSQPYFPLDDESVSPRFFKVLEVNMLTQDLVIVCPAEYGKQLLDSARRHHGVAHFLFHPAHIQKAGVAETLGGLIDYGRTQEMEWWTNEQICQWETLRREVQAKFDSSGSFTLRAPRRLDQATLLVLKPQQAPRSIAINGRPAQGARWNLHGFEFDAVTVDLVGEINIRMA
jgi:hypothetical protein